MTYSYTVNFWRDNDKLDNKFVLALLEQNNLSDIKDINKVVRAFVKRVNKADSLAKQLVIAINDIKRKRIFTDDAGINTSLYKLISRTLKKMSTRHLESKKSQLVLRGVSCLARIDKLDKIKLYLAQVYNTLDFAA